MKKLLFLSFFISTQLYGQTKVEAVLGDSDTGAAIKGTANNAAGIGGQFSNTNTGKALVTSGGLRFGGSNVGTIAIGKFLKATNTDGDAQWADLFPADYDLTRNNGNLLFLRNLSTTANSSTILAITNTSSTGVGAVEGLANISDPSGFTSGVRGINNSTNDKGYGVYGQHAGGGAGVLGKADTGNGVYGYSEGKHGVYGISFGSSANGIGVYGIAPDGSAIKGSSFNGTGIFGLSEGSGTAGYFSSQSGYSLLTGNGRVGIGIATPNNLLDVNGRMRLRHNSATSGLWMSNSTNGLSEADGAFYGMKNDTETGIWIGNGWRFWVNSAGNGYLNGNLIQTSDKRLKKDFSGLRNSLTTISQLNGYHFKWAEESRSKDLQTGLIAQEVQKIFPELVQTDEKGFLSVNYIGLVPHLIEAVKELRQENNALKNKNQTLESRLDKIEALLNAQLQPTETLKSK